MNNNLVKIQEMCRDIESYIQEEMELAELDNNEDYFDALNQLLIGVNAVEGFDPEIEKECEN